MKVKFNKLDLILKNELFNDNFCDCSDGTDETWTNACENSVFTCKNRYYKSHTIRASLVNDNVCDCCDGSDEKKYSICQNDCIKLSIKEQENLNKTIDDIVYHTRNLNIDEKLRETKEKLEILLKKINRFHEIYKKYLVINKYYMSIEDDGVEKYDKNGIEVQKLINKLNTISSEVDNLREFINKNKNFIDEYLGRLIILGSDDCRTFQTDEKLEIKLCFFDKVELIKKVYRQHVYENLGNFQKSEKNIFYYTNGDKCHKYNRNYKSQITFECSDKDSFELSNPTPCDYKIIYRGTPGCNYLKLIEIRETIQEYLNNN